MTATESVPDLTERLADTIRIATTPILLDEARKLCNAVGIREARDALGRARAAVSDGVDAITAAATALVSAQETERQAKVAYDDAFATACWVTEASQTWEKDGNATVLVHRVLAESLSDEQRGAAGEPDRQGYVEVRRRMTADQRAAYIESEARKRADVVRAAKDLTEATHRVALAKVDLETRENQARAARYEADLARSAMDGVVAELTTLARSLGGGS